MQLDRMQRQVDNNWEIRREIKKIIFFFEKFLVGIYGDMNGELIAILHGHVGGITHLKFSSDGNRLYSGARKVIWINF